MSGQRRLVLKIRREPAKSGPGRLHFVTAQSIPLRQPRLLTPTARAVFAGRTCGRAQELGSGRTPWAKARRHWWFGDAELPQAYPHRSDVQWPCGRGGGSLEIQIHGNGHSQFSGHRNYLSGSRSWPLPDHLQDTRPVRVQPITYCMADAGLGQPSGSATRPVDARVTAR